MDINIRVFKIGDGSQVSMLLKLLNKNSEFSENGLLTSGISTGFVAETEAGFIVGFAALCFRFVPSHGKLTASIEDVIVHPNCRRQGIAGKLLDAIILEARARKLAAINLSSNNAREEAVKLYKSKGFERLDSNVMLLRLGK